MHNDVLSYMVAIPILNGNASFSFLILRVFSLLCLYCFVVENENIFKKLVFKYF